LILFNTTLHRLRATVKMMMRLSKIHVFVYFPTNILILF